MKTFNRHAASETRSKLEKAGMLRWFHWVVVLLSLGLTVFAWSFAKRQHQERVALKFDQTATQTIDLVIERMAKYEDALWAGAAFLETVDGNVDHQLWSRYAASLQIDQKYPGINGIGVIAELDPNKSGPDIVERFLQDQRADRPDFAIHPAQDSDQSLPIMAISPLEGNEQAVGLDMAHETNRMTAAQKSITTGTAQVTGPIVLVQDAQSTPGFLFFAPFTGNQPSRDTEYTFDGLVYAPFVFHKLMKGVLDKDRRQVSIRISDGDDVLFDELSAGSEDFDADPLIKRQVSTKVYGRVWEFDIWSSKSFRESVQSNQASSILFGGLFIDGLLMYLFYMISRGARRSLRFADEVTSDLESFGLAARVNKIGVFDFNPPSGELKWNDAMFDIYGVDRSNFQQSFESWAECVHPEDLEPTVETLQESLSGGDSFESEFRTIHPDGSIRYLSAKAVVFRDRNGNAIRLLGANTDITEQKSATEALAATQQIQAAIHDAAGVAIVATDMTGLIVAFNSSAESMLGYDKDEMINRCTPAVFHDPDEVVVRAAELSLELGQTIEPGFDVFVAKAAMGKPEQREWTYTRKDGTTLPVLLTVTAIRDDAQKITGFLGVAADITERKEALLEIERSNASLARSNEELAQFAYVASHDLQEPLRKVTSFCELLREDCADQLTDDGVTYMGFIMDGAGRMRTLIQDLLSYSSLDNEIRSKREVNVGEAVQSAIENLSTSVADSDAEVIVGELPSVQGDPRQFAQLFQNLIGNAIKYRSDTKPCVYVGGEIAGGRCRYWVDDNGIGIEPQFREQIFGIFKRLHNRSKYSGTGIGLAICKRIVDRLDGRIWVEESQRGGCRFLFEFDIADDPSNGDADTADADKGRSEPAQQDVSANV